MDLEIYNSEEKEIWQSGILQDLFPGDLIVELGRCFLKTPYRAGTLETPGREKLEVNLNEFDCMTFVETVLALAIHSDGDDLSPSQLSKHLKQIRYRLGKIAGYASRLHYFTDWLSDNQKKKILKNVTGSLGGKPLRKKINFMTANRSLYPALKNKAAYEKMLLVEKRISGKAFDIIDRNHIGTVKSKIQQGDIIAFATDEEGLDVSHVGFAVKQGKNIHLLHASSSEHAVVVSKMTLEAYIKAHKKITGIMVARLVHGV